MINVEVEKNNNESNTNLIKRFTRRVQGSGVLSRIRGMRYAKRSPSRYVRKKKTLKYLTRKTAMEKMIKLGKMPEKTTR